LKILFISAHPDDLELCIGEFIYRLNKIHDILIVSATRGEWGTVNNKLKGKWLAKIRENELKDAASVHGVGPKKVKFFNYVDGGIKFQDQIINELKKFILENKFDAIFAPEYYYTYYFHPDHVNLGKIFLYNIFKLNKHSRPRLFFYHSIYNNRFIKVNMRRTQKAVMKHKTQILIIGFFIALRPIINLFNGILSKKLPFAEAVREVDFENELQLKLPFKYKILFNALKIGKIFERPWTAEEDQL